MAHWKQAALGFRVHSGWTAMVAVCVEGGEPVVLARKRARLVENFAYTYRQPYHTAEKMELREARAFVARMRAESRRLAYRAIRDVEEDVRQQGAKLTRCGLLLASGRELPELDKIVSSHALIHTADGELFREALLDASARCGLRDFTIKEKELLDRAGQVFRAKPEELIRRATELGRSLGAPWSQDEKFATLAAWLALSPAPKSDGRTRS